MKAGENNGLQKATDKIKDLSKAIGHMGEIGKQASKAGTELALVALSLRIIATKWWQFRKRNKLAKQAKELAEKNDIKW